MYIGIDLGTTNIKAALYSADMQLVDRLSGPMEYLRSGDCVEFDADECFEKLLVLLQELLAKHQVTQITQLAFTGQAETLVCVGADGRPLMNAISWMDERSREECEELARLFPAAKVRAVTGQQAVLPTWPATKIMWLRRHRADVFSGTACFMLLKDYMVYRFTGRRLCDMSIATFTLYFDIFKKCYWKEMLDAVGISEAVLPELCEPLTVAGTLLPGLMSRLGLTGETAVNLGTLDHFAGMIGTGNVSEGRVTLSTGTVMALAAIAPEPAAREGSAAMHYGFTPGMHVLLPVAESGGVSLEWFRRSCLPTLSFAEIDREILSRPETDIVFLPYLVGTNAPEFDADASGLFFGLRCEHDAFDMARAVMEGVAFVLKKNCEAMRAAGTELSAIIATGGGSKSALWCQIQADITGLPVVVPAEGEAACLGAAMIAAVGGGRFAGLSEAAEQCVQTKSVYLPKENPEYARKERRFRLLYEASLQAARI